MPKISELTLKQEGFKRDLLKTNNPTEAADRNYDCKNRHVAEQIAYENMRKPEIQAAIRQEFKKEDLTVEWVLEGLKSLATNSDDEHVKTKNLELIGKYLKMFTEKIETKDVTERDIPVDPGERKQEVDHLLDRLNKING